jgi:hypothetical protein
VIIMRIMVQAPIGERAGLAEIEIRPEHTVSQVKSKVCSSFGVNPKTVALMYGGEVLNERKTMKALGITDGAQLALMPLDIIGGL